MVGVLITLALAGVQVEGSPSEVPWGKGKAGYEVASGVTFNASDEKFVQFELRGPRTLKNKTVQITIERDGTHQSVNKVTFKRMRRGPKKLGFGANIGFPLPDGKHQLTITSDATGVAVLAHGTRKVAKRFQAAAEVALASESPDMESDDGEEVAITPQDPVPPPVASASGPTDVGDLVAIGEEATSKMEAERAAPHGVAKALRVAVYDFELQGIDPSIGSVVTDSILAEVRKLQGVSAIGMDEIRDMLSHEANKQILGCEGTESCLAEIAGALGVDNLVSGTLTKAAEGHVILVRRIDQQRAKVIGTVNQRLQAGSGEEFLAAVGPSIEELFSERQLKEGFTRGVPAEMALRLDPPPLPEWSFWTVAGTAVAAAAAGGVFGLLAQSEEDNYQTLASSGGVISGAELVATGKRAEDRAKMANISYISAGVLAVAAGVIALFTDWHGYGEAEQSLSVSK